MFGTNGNLDVINYNIYIDETYTNPWQHTRGGAGLFNITGTGNIQNTIIYGKLNLNQYVNHLGLKSEASWLGLSIKVI